MMFCCRNILVLVLINVNEIFSFSCVSSSVRKGISIRGLSQNCAASVFGLSFQNKCIVTITKVGGVITKTNGGCFVKGVRPDLVCDKTTSTDRSTTIRICCCSSHMCNDDAFLQKCKDGDRQPLRCISQFRNNSFVSNSVSESCNANAIGQQKCMVSIRNEGKRASITSGCLPKDSSTSLCGKTFQSSGRDFHMCCCNGDMCNNYTFLESCEAEASKIKREKTSLVTASPKNPIAPFRTSSFKCYSGFNRRSFSTNEFQDCGGTTSKSRKCMVSITKIGSSTITRTGCLPKFHSISSCGETTRIGNEYVRMCCCNSEMCNDAAFVKTCMKRGSRSISISIVGNSVHIAVIVNVLVLLNIVY